MSDSKDLMPLADKDYRAIEAAVMESSRGRWFLSEYAQRNRHSDTLTLLEAIHKLEENVGKGIPQAQADDSDGDKIKFDLMEMASAIAQTKNEIAALTPENDDDSRFMAATQELDAIVTATEGATGDILDAAESVQEIIWTMREAGTAEAECDKLEALITQVYTACSFQDITGQRITKVVALLKYLEERLDSMFNIWGGDKIASAIPAAPPIDTRADAHLLNGPQLDGQGNEQDDIDLMFVEAGTHPTSPDSPEQDSPIATKTYDETPNPAYQTAEEAASAEFAQTTPQPSEQMHASEPVETVEAHAEPVTENTNALSDLDQDDKHALFT